MPPELQLASLRSMSARIIMEQVLCGVLLAQVGKAAGEAPFKKPMFYHEGEDHIFGIILGLVLGVGLLVIIGVIAFVKFCSRPSHLQGRFHGAEPEPPQFVLFPRLQRSRRNESPPGHDSEEAEMLLQAHRFDELPSYAASFSHENDDSAAGSVDGASERPNMEVSEVLAVLQVGRRSHDRPPSLAAAQESEEAHAEEVLLEETPH